jgi:hypothetical protein
MNAVFFIFSFPQKTGLNNGLTQRKNGRNHLLSSETNAKRRSSLCLEERSKPGKNRIDTQCSMPAPDQNMILWQACVDRRLNNNKLMGKGGFKNAQ